MSASGYSNFDFYRLILEIQKEFYNVGHFMNIKKLITMKIVFLVFYCLPQVFPRLFDSCNTFKKNDNIEITWKIFENTLIYDIMDANPLGIRFNKINGFIKNQQYARERYRNFSIKEK